MLDGSGVKAMPCQDRYLHTILVHYRKIRKYRKPNGTNQKIYLKKDFIDPLYLVLADSANTPLYPLWPRYLENIFPFSTF
jgi:hypothetical protein